MAVESLPRTDMTLRQASLLTQASSNKALLFAGFVVIFGITTELNWRLKLAVIRCLAAIKSWNILAILIMNKSNPAAKPTTYSSKQPK